MAYGKFYPDGRPIPARVQKGRIPDWEWEQIRAIVTDAKERAERAARDAAPKAPPRPPEVFGYRRCSHQDSKESGLGLNAQTGTITAYYRLLESKWQAEGQPVLPFHKLFSDEAISARTQLIARPDGAKLNHALKKGDHVIFPRLDRGFRDLEDLIRTVRDWETRGITIHFVAEGIDTRTSIGRLIMHILGAVAQWQSEYIGDRGREMAHVFRKLGRNGGGKAPMGFKLVGPKSDGIRRKVVPDIPTRKIMGLIVRLRDEEGMTYKAISDYIEDRIAQKEKRSPIPFYDRGKRKWPDGRCHKAYFAEKKLREQALSNPELAAVQERAASEEIEL